MVLPNNSSQGGPDHLRVVNNQYEFSKYVHIITYAGCAGLFICTETTHAGAISPDLKPPQILLGYDSQRFMILHIPAYKG